MVGPLENNGRQQSHGDYHSIPQTGKACALDIRVLLASRLCYPHNLPRKVTIQTQYAISKLDWEMILTCCTLTVDSGRESEEIADPPSVQLVVLDIFHPMVYSLSSLHSINS